MAKYVVAGVEEIPPGERKVLEIAGRSVGIFNVGGEFFALRNTCPHQGGPLCQGRLTGFVMSRAPGEYSYTRRGEILRCPWHGWEFDVKTGQSWFDPVQTRVRAYAVSVERQALGQEETPERSLDAPAESGEGKDETQEGLAKGPYVAESYEVQVERRTEQNVTREVIVVDIP